MREKRGKLISKISKTKREKAGRITDHCFGRNRAPINGNEEREVDQSNRIWFCSRDMTEEQRAIEEHRGSSRRPYLRLRVP